MSVAPEPTTPVRSLARRTLRSVSMILPSRSALPAISRSRGVAAQSSSFAEGDVAPMTLYTDWRRTLRSAFVVIFVVFGVFGTWSAFARLDGGAVASGVVAVESTKKTVQHLEGGIVQEILVRDGDLVRAGDALLRLDATRAQSTSDLLASQLAMHLATEARLVAEREGALHVVFPEEVVRQRHDPEVKRAVLDQEAQFAARTETTRQQIEILGKQIGQVKSEIEAIELERETSVKQLRFVDEELNGLRSLLQRQLVQLTRVSTMEREQLRLSGMVLRSHVDVSKAEQKISETRLAIHRLRQEQMELASKQLPETRQKIAEIRQQLRIAQDTLKRIELRAPIDGTVQQSRLFTIGGVLGAGQPVLDIVPHQDELVVRAKINPIDINVVSPGMKARIRFPSFQKERVTTLDGVVRTVSRDRILDEVTREPYFAAEVRVDRAAIPEDLRAKVVAGLSADVVIPTGERTALNYLTAPIFRGIEMSMRER